MSRILTSRQVKGGKWAEAHPDKADDLWVVATVSHKRRKRFIGPPTPENQREAERKRAAWAVLLDSAEISEVPTFREAGDAYLRSGLTSNAWSTVGRRNQQVALFQERFGSRSLDQIQAADLVIWADEMMEKKSYDPRTVYNYLDAVARVYEHAARTVEITNPVPAARKKLKTAERRTASYRARNEANKNPLSVAEIWALLPKLDDPALRIAVHLMYEGGLRIGEAQGLLWEDCWMGRDDTDATRHLKIQRQVDGNGRAIPLTKSGRTRQVAMSRRLRTMLLEYRMAQGRPEDSERVVGLARSTARKLLGTACKQAKLEPRKFKDFRDTFASLLVQHGISLTWVSMQLGHASIQTTQAHYARWLPRDGYTNPWQVPPGGVPTDLFAALDSGGVPSVSLCVPGTGETQ